jgi:hypothetical protein
MTEPPAEPAAAPTPEQARPADGMVVLVKGPDGRLHKPVDPDAPPPPRWFERPEDGFRMLPPIDDDAIVDAVTTARALVALDERRWRQSMELAAERALSEQIRHELKLAQRHAMVLRTMTARVEALHREKVRVRTMCGDGCCAEEDPLGVCDHCGQKFPCSTIRALESAGTRDERRAAAGGPKL